MPYIGRPLNAGNLAVQSGTTVMDADTVHTDACKTAWAEFKASQE